MTAKLLSCPHHPLKQLWLSREQKEKKNKQKNKKKKSESQVDRDRYEGKSAYEREREHREWQCLAHKPARLMEPRWKGPGAGHEEKYSQSQSEQGAIAELNPRVRASTKDGLKCRNSSPLRIFASGWLLRLLALSPHLCLERVKAKHWSWGGTAEGGSGTADCIETSPLRLFSSFSDFLLLASSMEGSCGNYLTKADHQVLKINEIKELKMPISNQAHPQIRCFIIFLYLLNGSRDTFLQR